MSAWALTTTRPNQVTEAGYRSAWALTATRPNQSTKSRRAGLRIDVQNGLDLDGHVVRQRPEAHSAARMAPSLSEHIDEEV